ncbi:MAG: hypothetical protein ACRDOM_02835 [Nocardioides sp.]
MSTLWKVAIALVLALPMTAYVVGSLVASADEPTRPEPIIVEEESPDPPDRSGTPGDKQSREPGEQDDEDDDRNDDDGPPVVVTPKPDDLDDDSDDDGRDVDDADGDDDDDDDDGGTDD